MWGWNFGNCIVQTSLNMKAYSLRWKMGRKDYCLMWCLWQESNACGFEGCERTILDLKLLFFQIFVWMVASFRLIFLFHPIKFFWSLWVTCFFLIYIIFITYQKKKKFLIIVRLRVWFWCTRSVLPAYLGYTFLLIIFFT